MLKKFFKMNKMLRWLCHLKKSLNMLQIKLKQLNRRKFRSQSLKMRTSLCPKKRPKQPNQTVRRPLYLNNNQRLSQLWKLLRKFNTMLLLWFLCRSSRRLRLSLDRITVIK